MMETLKLLNPLLRQSVFKFLSLNPATRHVRVVTTMACRVKDTGLKLVSLFLGFISFLQYF